MDPRQNLEVHHKRQEATNIIADNTTACGIANRTSKIKRSKAMDMRYHWIRDRVNQGQFKVHWEPSKTNLADYFTKTHPVHHFVDMRSKYVGTLTVPDWTLVRSRKRSKERPNLTAFGTSIGSQSARVC